MRAARGRVARGVGAVVDPVLAAFLLEHPAALDYVALVPEMLWTDRGLGAAPRYVDLPPAAALADALAARYPVVLHGTGLSIGSALPLDDEHLARIAQVGARYGATRYSEQLGFFRVPSAPGRARHIGVDMPLPCDDAVLGWLVPRVRRAAALAGRPLLLRNGVHHTPYADEDMAEPVFLSRLARASGAGLLLDLQHLCTDWRNNGAAPDDFIADLDLRLVHEIQVTGGAPTGRAAGAAPAACPQAMLALLRDLVPRCPALEGITFACRGSDAPCFGMQALQRQLDALTDIWALREMEIRDGTCTGDCHVA